jgi:ParB family transcriptional regulator, chromosome partitioning protein
MATPKKNNELLGKGIRSLLQSIDSDMKTATGNLKPAVAEAVTSVNRIPIDKITPNPKQPRKDFDETALSELASSIKLHDIIQPITVTKVGNGYQLISGERRWRASKLAGLKDIPAYVRLANDAQLLELAVLENLQREDLNAIETALGYKRIIDELEYTQEQLAERMGKERSTVTNYLRLLKLPPDIQIAVRKGELSMGHARTLIGVEGIDKQLFVFKEIKTKELSVRATEEFVRNYINNNKSSVKTPPKSNLSPTYKKIEDTLASHFGAKVKLKHSSKGYGSITIDYFSLEEFNKILNQMQVSIS